MPRQLKIHKMKVMLTIFAAKQTTKIKLSIKFFFLTLEQSKVSADAYTLLSYYILLLHFITLNIAH